jgi:hypothetical protein
MIGPSRRGLDVERHFDRAGNLARSPRPHPDRRKNGGNPLAEISAEDSSVIAQHPPMAAG